MAKDEVSIAVSEMYGYHATRTEPKCSLEWMASCFVIPPSLKCRYLGTWENISDDIHLNDDCETKIPMPRLLTHEELHSESPDKGNYQLSPEKGNINNDYRHQQNSLDYEDNDPIDDYLTQYASMLSSKENDIDEPISPTTGDHSPEEKRRTFARRKSCPNVSSKTGLSISLSLPKEHSSVDDTETRNNASFSHSKLAKPETLDLKNITAIARRMSIPILDKSEDVDHGTKILAETVIKKNKSTKQFREAFSEETDDYIPHRHARTVTKSLTENEIESACDDLKTEKPGSYKNIVQELKLRGQDFNESHPRHYDGNDNKSTSNSSRTPTTQDLEHSIDNCQIKSPVQYNNVLRELQHRTDDRSTISRESNGSRHQNTLDSSFDSSFNSGDFYNVQKSSSDYSRREKSNTRTENSANFTRTRPVSYSNDERFSKTLPPDFGGNVSGSSTPRSNKSDSINRNKTAKQKSEEPVSDLMKKLNNLTAQTRLATRPSLGNVEGYEPAPMTRSHSVMHVSSPMSPKYDRSLLSSSFSSSTSSSSDIPSISYHDVSDPCYRCWKTVYSLDKIGPIRKVLYHKQCFRCAKCNTMLSLNTYRQNVNDKSDVQVYCKKHVPLLDSPHIGLEAKNLSVVMNHPKLDHVNQNIRGTMDDRRKSMNLHPLIVGRAVSTPRLDLICGPNENSFSDNSSTVDKNGNVSLRELKMDEQPRTVWSRSSFSAAKLDLSVPASGRKGSSLYRTADTWNYL